MPQHTCSARIPSADIHRAAPQQPPHECTCFCLIALQLMLLLARTYSTRILPRSGCHASVLLPQPLQLSPSAAIRCSAASCALLVRLLLRNRAPTLALISRAFYPAVVVTPLSSKLPQPLLLLSSAVICRAVSQQTLYKSACFCAIAPKHLMLQLARTCFTRILPRSGCRASVLLP
jgi:hypothetical protein